MSKYDLNKYELEIIGSEWKTQYVWAKNYFVSDKTITFFDENERRIAVYPVEITIIKTIEYADEKGLH